MVRSWPIVAHAEELARASTALQRGSEFRGVALFGEAGIGKTTLALLLAERMQSSKLPTRLVRGATPGDVPLGAFRHIVAVDETQDPAAMLAAAYTALTQPSDRPLIVDDAHCLDPLSVILIHQLAAGGETQLVVTIRSGVAVPDALTALWKEHYLLRLDIRAFSLADTAEVLRAELDDVIDDEAVDRLHHLSAGNPLLLRRLMTAGLENGAMVRKKGRWRLTGALHTPSDLDDVLNARVKPLNTDERDVVEIVAVAETLEWCVLREICTAEAVVSAERQGLIELSADVPKAVVRLTHPLLGVFVKKRLDTVRACQLNTRIAQQISLTARDAATRARLALFMTRSDMPPDLVLITEAAVAATRSGDFDTAEELARFAVDRGAGLRAVIALASAMAWQRRAGDAEALLGTADTSGADESERARWGCVRAANLFFGSGLEDAARTVLDGLCDDGAAQGLVTATEVAITFFSGDVRTAVSMGLAASPSEMAPAAAVCAAMATVGALGVAGRASEIPAVVECAEQAAARNAAAPQRFLMAMSEMLAFTLAGDLAAAEALRQRHAATVDAPHARALVDATVGRLHVSRGEIALACEALRGSLSVLAESFPSTWVTLIAAWLAQAEAMSGNRDAAAAAVAQAEDMIGPQAAVFRPELDLARAWERACAGELDGARRHAERAANAARSAGMYAVESHALHTAVRFGAPSHATRLAELARTVAGPFAAAAAAQARALADGNGDLLDDAASQFENIGMMALAVDAAAQASREHSRTGVGVRKWESASRALRPARQYGLYTPAIAAIKDSLPLTERERGLATLVGAGLSNREIAEELEVSLRTVESHLYRIFAKLGIERREQLAGLL